MSSPTNKQTIFTVSKIEKTYDYFEKSQETSKDGRYRTIWTKKVKSF